MESAERKETTLPVIGGALNIVCGVFGLIGGIVLLSLVYFAIIPVFLVALGIIIPIIGAIAIYGGICAIRREKFGWAILGGIFALLSFFILGLPGLILVIVAKDEFK
jgi:uncharacterized membrane protein